jgi:hypothetical protein
VWGIVLDCCEDKDDDHVEYGGLVCCHAFREAETEFIREVIARASTEYSVPDVRHKLVVCHIPFTAPETEPFNIEEELYAEWTALLRDHVKPEMILCGHEHLWEIYESGSEKDAYGQSCPVVVGSSFKKTGEKVYFSGTGLEFTPEGIQIKEYATI